MIRAAFIRPAATAISTSTSRAPKNKHHAATSIVRRFASIESTSLSPRILPRMMLNSRAGSLLARHSLTTNRGSALRMTALRSTSSSSSSKKESTKSSAEGASESAAGGAQSGEPISQEMVLTPGEKVVAGTRLFFWAGALAVASVCAFYIGKELLPTKMSPNTVFDKASTQIRQNSEVKRRFGESIKTYGRDHGGHREGRRNFIEHTEYTDPDDGSKRTRVRFNLEGEHGAALVFAEVSKEMGSGEFVYILVQDKRNGAVITVVDNRSSLLAQRMAGGSAEGRDVFSSLLGTGGSKS